MKIHKKTDLPARDGKEEFSLTVLTCDKRGITTVSYTHLTLPTIA